MFTHTFHKGKFMLVVYFYNNNVISYIWMKFYKPSLSWRHTLTKVYDVHLQSPDFPLSVDMLLNVLEVIAPFKHFSKLREFVLMKLPPGFPVKIGE